jgi:hypothetical protein
MFRNLYLALALSALVVFAYAQQDGWNLFDDTAHAGSSGGGHGGSGRVYHK